MRTIKNNYKQDSSALMQVQCSSVNRAENGPIFDNPKEDTAVDIDICSEDATTHLQ